jgi:hypothetical protein
MKRAKMSPENKNPCRHYLGLYPDDRPSCSEGWNVRKWARLGNGGSDHGIALRLPCTKQHGKKPLFDCPSVCRKTDEEIAAQRQEMSAHMDKIIAAMGMLQKIKESMIERGEPQTKNDCPWCKSLGTLHVTCAIGYNNHVICKCSECGEGFME